MTFLLLGAYFDLKGVSASPSTLLQLKLNILGLHQRADDALVVTILNVKVSSRSAICLMVRHGYKPIVDR